MPADTTLSTVVISVRLYISSIKLRTIFQPYFRCLQWTNDPVGLARIPGTRNWRLPVGTYRVSSPPRRRMTNRVDRPGAPGPSPSNPGRSSTSRFSITHINSSSNSSAPNHHHSEPCPRYALIKERANPKDSPICGGNRKEMHVYTSVSNNVEIQIISQDVFNWNQQFLIHYEGCATKFICSPCMHHSMLSCCRPTVFSLSLPTVFHIVARRFPVVARC